MMIDQQEECQKKSIGRRASEEDRQKKINKKIILPQGSITRRVSKEEHITEGKKSVGRKSLLIFYFIIHNYYYYHHP
ncbi:MAG: hypothetical protein O7C56_09085 [Rickettsia endosymbiont of Ixodes persulcatus]|nr:hypothetical protein [Rickettsia endosymbiont of Ixodes persulcatus]